VNDGQLINAKSQVTMHHSVTDGRHRQLGKNPKDASFLYVRRTLNQ
jgi:hypothetical protein